MSPAFRRHLRSPQARLEVALLLRQFRRQRPYAGSRAAVLYAKDHFGWTARQLKAMTLSMAGTARDMSILNAQRDRALEIELALVRVYNLSQPIMGEFIAPPGFVLLNDEQ